MKTIPIDERMAHSILASMNASWDYGRNYMKEYSREATGIDAQVFRAIASCYPEIAAQYADLSYSITRAGGTL